MQIREFKPTDRNRVIKMVREILKSIFNGNPTQFAILKEFKQTKNYILFLIAEQKNKIIGCSALKKIDKDTVRLKRLYIDEEYRRKGIAQRMLNKIVDFAKENNFKKIKFSAYPIMKDAHKFFKKNKFTEIRGNDIEQIHVMKNTLTTYRQSFSKNHLKIPYFFQNQLLF